MGKEGKYDLRLADPPLAEENDPEIDTEMDPQKSMPCLHFLFQLHKSKLI